MIATPSYAQVLAEPTSIVWTKRGAMENQHGIQWDNGSNLSLLEGKDRFKFID